MLGTRPILPGRKAHRRQFFDASGQPETPQDPRFSRAATRARHDDSLYAIVADVVALLDACNNPRPHEVRFERRRLSASRRPA